MPRYGGAGGLAQLRHESARDSLADEGLARSTLRRLVNLAIGIAAMTAARTVSSPMRCAHVHQLIHLRDQHREGVVQAMRAIHERDGLRGFFQGNLSSCLGLAISGTIKLSMWISFRHFLEDETGRVSNYRSAVLAGIACGAAAVVATRPFELIATRTVDAESAGQLRQGVSRYRQVVAAVVNQAPMGKGVNARDGLEHLYLGWNVTLASYLLQELTLHLSRELLFLFESKPTIRKYLIRVDDELKQVARDIIAFLIARVVCLPLINIEHWMAFSNTGFIESCRDIYNAGGVPGFYTGAIAQLAVIPHFICYHAIMQGAYSFLERLSGDVHHRL